MKIFEFTRRARLDLLKIVENLGENNPKAISLLSSIEARCRLVAEFPESGRLRDDLSPGLRSVLVDPYLIFYQKPAGHVQIIRILHGRRDLKSLFRKRDS